MLWGCYLTGRDAEWGYLLVYSPRYCEYCYVGAAGDVPGGGGSVSGACKADRVQPQAMPQAGAGAGAECVVSGNGAPWSERRECAAGVGSGHGTWGCTKNAKGAARGATPSRALGEYPFHKICQNS